MQFLSDVYLRCPDCDGTRYRAELLDIQLEGGLQCIADVLELTVAEAAQRFADDRELRAAAAAGRRGPGLPAPGPAGADALGGEAQRLKLAGAPGRGRQQRPRWRAAKGTLFLFDEPTTGLHFDDIAKLLRALRKLLAPATRCW
jgi:excinuclease ABC subunit A